MPPPEPSLVFLADEQTARLSPDALRVMLGQSGFRCRAEPQPSGDVDLVLEGTDDTALLLAVESGTVVEIAVRQTFVDAPGMKRIARLSEFLESMGWFREE